MASRPSEPDPARDPPRVPAGGSASAPLGGAASGQRREPPLGASGAHRSREASDSVAEASSGRSADSEAQADSDGEENGVLRSADSSESDSDEAVRAPWHFKLLVVGTVVYLGYRLYQGIELLIHHL